MLFGPAYSASCVKQLHGVSKRRSGQSLSSVGMAMYTVGMLLVMEVLEEEVGDFFHYFWRWIAIDAWMDLQAAACTLWYLVGCYVYMSDQSVSVHHMVADALARFSSVHVLHVLCCVWGHGCEEAHLMWKPAGQRLLHLKA